MVGTMSDKNKGQSSKPLSVWITEEKIARLDERAESIGLTRSKYVLLILDKWFADGEPPVSKTDEVMRLMDRESGKQKGESGEDSEK